MNEDYEQEREASEEAEYFAAQEEDHQRHLLDERNSRCQQCGKCCENIPIDFNIQGDVFRKMCEEMCHNKRMDFSRIEKITISLAMQYGTGIPGQIASVRMTVFPVTCMALIPKDGKKVCSVYPNREATCKEWPFKDSKFPEGCVFAETKAAPHK